MRPFYITMILGLACGGCAGESGAVDDPPSLASSTAAVRVRELSRDAVQSSYRTTAVRLADGMELAQGQAELEIRYDESRPQLTLKLTAGDRATSWNAALPLDVSEVLPERVDLPMRRGSVRTTSKNRVELEQPAARFTLERGKVRGRRTRFSGQIFDVAGAELATFQTELAVRCLVPPEMIGAKSNGHAVSAGITLLVPDDDFASEFCAKFLPLL